MLGGIMAALVCIYPRHLLSHVTAGNLAVGLLAFSAGALPLIVYNVENDFPTFRSNVHFSLADFGHKLEILKLTANGSIWLGSVTNESTAPMPRSPENRAERWTKDFHSLTGDHRHEYMSYTFMAGVLLTPAMFFWRRFAAARLLLFCIIALAIAWLQMALTEGGGGRRPPSRPDVALARSIHRRCTGGGFLALESERSVATNGGGRCIDGDQCAHRESVLISVHSVRLHTELERCDGRPIAPSF